MANETKQKAPRRYEKMRDSGVEWIGTVPEHWQVRPVKAYYKIVTGFTPPSKQDDLYDDNGEIWVTISDMVTPIIKNSKQHITVDYALTHIKEKVPKGSLLYSFKLSVGNVAIAGTELYTNEAIASFIPSDTISIPFLKYSSSLIVGNAVQNIYGAAIMNQQRILNAPIVFPPLSEQNIIAEYLEKKCKDIDIVIAEAKAGIEEYKAWKSSIIYEAVTKGLDPSTEMKDSGVAWIGKVPMKWHVCKTLFALQMPITDGPHTTPELYDSGVPFVSAEAVSCGNGHIDFNHIRGYISEDFYLECCKKYIPQRDDVYMIKSGATTGKVAIVDVDTKFTIWSPLAVFRANPQKVLPRYLFYFLQSPAYQKQVEFGWSFGTQQNIGMRTLEKLKICVPPLPVQQEIIRYLDDKSNKLDALIQEKADLISDLESYKKSLIYEVVTGKQKVV